MARYKAMSWGEGSRRKQPVYERSENGKVEKGAKILYSVWKGYDWMSFDLALEARLNELGIKIEPTKRERSELKVKVHGATKRDGTRNDLIEILEKKRNAITRKIEGGTAAELYVAELQQRLEDKSPTGKITTEFDSAPTLDEVIEKYFASGATKRQSDHGAGKKYRGFWDNHIKLQVSDSLPALGSLVMADIKQAHLQAFDQAVAKTRNAQVRKFDRKAGTFDVVWEEREELSAKTFDDLLSFIRQVFVFAMTRNMQSWTGVKYNVAKEYVPDRPKDQKGKNTRAKTHFTGKQILTLLDKAVEIGDHSLAALMALVTCGDRPTAMRSLEWGMWDDELGGFHLEGQWIVFKGERKFVAPKNKKAKLVYVPRGMFERYVLPTKAFSNLVVPVSEKDSDRMMSEGCKTDRWKKLQSIEGMPKGNLYDLKSSIAEILSELGYSNEQIGIALGITGEIAGGKYAVHAAIRKQMLDEAWEKITV